MARYLDMQNINPISYLPGESPGNQYSPDMIARGIASRQRDINAELEKTRMVTEPHKMQAEDMRSAKYWSAQADQAMGAGKYHSALAANVEAENPLTKAAVAAMIPMMGRTAEAETSGLELENENRLKSILGPGYDTYMENKKKREMGTAFPQDVMPNSGSDYSVRPYTEQDVNNDLMKALNIGSTIPTDYKSALNTALGPTMTAINNVMEPVGNAGWKVGSSILGTSAAGGLLKEGLKRYTPSLARAVGSRIPNFWGRNLPAPRMAPRPTGFTNPGYGAQPVAKPDFLY